MNKPYDYWVVFFGMALYVALRDWNKMPVRRSAATLVVSGALAFGLSDIAAPWLFGSEKAALVIIMGFGVLMLNAASVIVSDPKLLKDLIRLKFGGGSNE